MATRLEVAMKKAAKTMPGITEKRMINSFCPFLWGLAGDLTTCTATKKECVKCWNTEVEEGEQDGD